MTFAKQPSSLWSKPAILSSLAMVIFLSLIYTFNSTATPSNFNNIIEWMKAKAHSKGIDERTVIRETTSANPQDPAKKVGILSIERIDIAYPYERSSERLLSSVNKQKYADLNGYEYDSVQIDSNDDLETILLEAAKYLQQRPNLNWVWVMNPNTFITNRFVTVEDRILSRALKTSKNGEDPSIIAISDEQTEKNWRSFLLKKDAFKVGDVDKLNEEGVAEEWIQRMQSEDRVKWVSPQEVARGGDPLSTASQFELGDFVVFDGMQDEVKSENEDFKGMRN